MAEKNLLGGEPFLKQHKFHNRWRKVVTAMASVVVFCTTYALILPAITMEKTCPLPEHTHGDSCYETQQVQTLACQVQPHTHTAGCYDEGGQIVCGYEDFFVHVHSESCYGPDSQLLCPLPQVREHTHTEDCDTLRPHPHGPECYTKEKVALVCQQEEMPGHAHSDACSGAVQQLICTQEETAGHTHGEECLDADGNTVCGLEEAPAHTHGSECYETTLLECPLEETEGHTHTDACWEWSEKLTCEIPEQERVLTCQRREVNLHTHGDSCYDGGTLVCGKREVLAHNHGEDCFQPGEIQVLTCTQQEHTHDETCTPAADTLEIPAGDGAQPVVEGTTASTEEPTEGTGEPLTLEPTSAVLSYKLKDETNWTEITGNEQAIPGDASFRLQVGFTVKTSDLKNAGYRMDYNLPKLFRDVNATEAILDSSNATVGTMSVTDKVVQLKFNEDWTGLTEDSISGYFYVEAQADLAQIPEGGTTEIKVGETTIKINFDSDLVAKYGEVTLDKAMGVLEENVPDESGTCYDYITYTLKVTAGPYGCPTVTVVDSFTAGSQYVDCYIIPEGSGATAADGKLTWTIGDMNANEERTLTYKVRLKPDYLGAKPKKETLTNVATVFSKSYKRDTSTQTFEPKGSATMSKMASEFKPNDSGGGTIQYTVWVHADKDNTYTLENVTIWDALDGAVDGSYKTEGKFLDYISYDEDSFAYYIGGSKEQNGPGNLQPTPTSQKPVFAENRKSFRFNVGNLAPGDDRLLIYEVTVDAGIFTKSNEDFQINNRAYIITDPKRSDGAAEKLESYKQEKKITTKKWARKLLGEKVTEETTVDMGNATFTVPAGSQEYKVVVNETGDWDVSSAVMQDNLNSTHMAYVGYVRVAAYQAAQNTNYGSDAAAAEALEKLTPVQTAWWHIDGKTAFEFKPIDLGLPVGNYVYMLTYYAQPKNMEGYSTVIVANQFDLTGTVGINGKPYTLGGIRVSAEVQLEGSNHFGAQKRFWYYDAAAEGQENGTMYWVLKLSGSTLPGNTMLLDAIEEGPHRIGKVERAFIADYDLELSKDQTPDALDGVEFSDYESETTDMGLELTLIEDVPLDGKCLYFVISTYPTEIPQVNGDNRVYKNALSTKDPGADDNWVKVSEDQTYVVAGDNLYKSMMEVFQVEAGDTADTTEITYKQGKANTVLQKDYLMNSGNGIYVAWYVSVNHTATLNGRYRVHETIPQGMELVYVQRYSTAGRRDVKFQEIPDLGGNWKQVKQDFTYKDDNRTTAIYYVNGQNVIWEFEEKEPNPSVPGSRYVDYLVVCKVTDSALLLGGVEKTYVNQVTLTDTSGKELGKGSADVTLQIPTLSKTGTYDEKVNGGRYPFQIVLNELGTDLVPGAKTIKLIDEMCEVLILDPSSIKVVNTKTQESVEFTAAISGQILTLTLPDDQPLTITYEATINAAPGQVIEIKNNAHWEGYTTAPGGAVSVSGFSYKVGALVGASTNPELTIVKVDQYNASKKLSGATFTLTEMELKDGQLVEKSGGLSLTGTTDQNGTIVFGKEDGNNLQCNVPYRLVETAAPSGYVLDDTPHYVVFAKAENEIYPEILEAYKTAGAHVHYSRDFKYTYTAYNHKGEIVVEKKFQNADGSPLGKIDGTYTFGLYEKDTNKLLQKATVRWANGVIYPSDGKARFTNVELGKTYVVYELDDSGNPITSGSGTVDGVPFLVSYPEGELTVTADSPTANTQVTNRLNYAELPSTGGPGRLPYTLGGLLLLAVGLTLLYNQRKRRREGSTPS